MSLKLTNDLRKEWPQYLREFVEEGKLDADMLRTHAQLFFVGLIGSPDNKFCDTERAIGADTALHRVSE